jgi:hypothetical protein
MSAVVVEARAAAARQRQGGHHLEGLVLHDLRRTFSTRLHDAEQ